MGVGRFVPRSFRTFRVSLLTRLIRDVGRAFRAERGCHAYSEFMTAGCDYQRAGRLAEAVDCFTRALITKPDSVDAYVCRSVALKAQGEVAKAIDDAVSALDLDDSPVAKFLFVDCIEKLRFTQERLGISRLLARALTETWCRPKQLDKAAVSLIKQDTAISAWLQRPADELFGPAGLGAIAGHDLLLAPLTTTPVCDLELERFLTVARRAMLGRVGKVGADELALRFGGALARQCFINEYVFEPNDEEACKVVALKESLQYALESRSPVDPFNLVVLGSYCSLRALEGAEGLLAEHWPNAVDKLLTQQIREPAEETRLASGIPQITPIGNRVSKLVREQYEENPYPRWVTTVPAKAVESMDIFLERSFPCASYQPIEKVGRMDILVAGCGTGQHSIEVGSRFPNASVLAVDLSLTSLAYAKRKTRELGIGNIEYAQADILELAALDRQFDLIEACGVLHHLGDPLAGWRVLLTLLRTKGIMAVGLYSERARAGINVARRFIAEKGYGCSAEDIRRCRAEMMVPRGSTLWRFESSDFFSLSACRDLLFHVQEHQFSLPEIKAFLAENRLCFLGFVLSASVKERYRTRFPDDAAMTDLDHWHAFEIENPYTFDAMYQFYVQRT